MTKGKDTNLTLEQIETILVGRPLSPFYIRKNIVVPNVDWGFLNHEADLLVMSKARHLTEIEIKRTWADFKADFKKSHTHYDKKLSHFYYAVPISIAHKVFDWLYEGELNVKDYYSYSKVVGYTENNPYKCGLIVYGESEHDFLERGCCLTVPAQRIGDYKVTDDEEKMLLRLLGMRVWLLKKKVAKLQGNDNL